MAPLNVAPANKWLMGYASMVISHVQFCFFFSKKCLLQNYPNFFFFSLLFFFFETVCYYVSFHGLDLNLQVRLTPNSWRMAWLCFLRAGVKSMYRSPGPSQNAQLKTFMAIVFAQPHVGNVISLLNLNDFSVDDLGLTWVILMWERAELGDS